MAVKSLGSFLLLTLQAQNVLSMTSKGRNGHGLIGYGIVMYKPTCAHACRDTISGSSLSCTEMSDMAGMGGMSMDMGSGETSEYCYATNDIYLQTMSYCMSSHCKDVPLSKLEQYWETYVVGRNTGQQAPKESYQEALSKVTERPTEVLVTGDPLNKTSLVTEDDWLASYNADMLFENIEVTHETYGIIAIVLSAGLPILFSLLRFVPFPAAWASKFNAWFIYPPAFGSRHNASVAGIVHVPTRGQALFILYLIGLNIILSFVGMSTNSPNAWYNSEAAQTSAYISNRVGVLSFANLPLLILYAGRNNFLLWVTNWSHSTFLLLHRYVAWIVTLQAVVHSILYLKEYVASGDHASESKLAYWIWGAAATVALSVMIPTATYPIRKRLYEVFLLWHISLAIIVVAGCYLHIIKRFQHQWGYEVWIFAAMAVWASERILRFCRIARNGICTAKVTVIDDDYIRVDVEGVSGGGHAFLYFPTLTWRVWENHPFSVASTILTPKSNIENKRVTHVDVEKSGAIAATTKSVDSLSQASTTIEPAKIGLTFLLRCRGGLTAQIRERNALPVLVESPYGKQEDLSSHPLLLCIAGGVGITACVPYLRAHPGRVKLVWGVRTEGIVHDLEPALAHIHKEVYVGRRMSVPEVLEKELSSAEDTVVVVSGPSEMADEVRVNVARLGRQRKGLKVTLVEEAFSW